MFFPMSTECAPQKQQSHAELNFLISLVSHGMEMNLKRQGTTVQKPAYCFPMMVLSIPNYSPVTEISQKKTKETLRLRFSLQGDKGSQYFTNMVVCRVLELGPKITYTRENKCTLYTKHCITAYLALLLY